MRGFLPTLSFLLFAAIATTALAQADCSYEVRTHISMADSFYKDYETYSHESSDTSEGLAKAEWDNFIHEMDWVQDHGNMMFCDNPSVNQRYYYLKFWRDLTDADVQVFDDTAHASSRRAALDILRSDVSLLFSYGFYKVNPGAYAALKMTVKDLYVKAHLPFTSWETQRVPETHKNQAAAPKVVPESKRNGPDKRPCSQPHVDVRVVKAVEPAMSDTARRQGAVGTVQVRVTLDVDGSVLGASIYKSSGNSELEKAALAAARASTYSPEMQDCHPVGGTSQANET